MSTLEIIQGADKTFFIRLTQKDTGEPYDLTGTSEISVLFGKADESVLTKKMTDPNSPVEIIEAKTGKIKVKLEEADTASLKDGEGQSFEASIEKTDLADPDGKDTIIVQFIELLTVKKRVFSA